MQRAMKRHFRWSLLGLLLLNQCTQPAAKAPLDETRAQREAVEREVAELRRQNEELEKKIAPPPVPPAPEGPVQLLRAKKQFDADFKPVLLVSLRNVGSKSIQQIELTFDFSYNLLAPEPNCGFSHVLKQSLKAGTTLTTTIAIPASYDKKCSDRAQVKLRRVLYTNGEQQTF